MDVKYAKLISAAINRNVSVKLLVSDRANSRPYMKRLLKSLLTLNGLKQTVSIEIKLFSAVSTLLFVNQVCTVTED